LIKKLIAEFPDDFGFSLSHTTRDPRPGEQVGDDYRLVNREKMQGETDAGPVVEHVEVHENLYGNSISAVQEVTKKCRVCLLDIDVQGAESVYGEHSLFIFRFNNTTLMLDPITKVTGCYVAIYPDLLLKSNLHFRLVVDCLNETMSALTLQETLILMILCG